MGLQGPETGVSVEVADECSAVDGNVAGSNPPPFAKCSNGEGRGWLDDQGMDIEGSGCVEIEKSSSDKRIPVRFDAGMRGRITAAEIGAATLRNCRNWERENSYQRG